MTSRSLMPVLRRKLKTIFLMQLVYLFEDDAVTYLKTKMPLGHRKILQNQTVIMVLLSAAFPAPFIIAGIVFWLVMTIEFFLIYVFAVWAYFVVLGIVWLKMTRRRLGGAKDVRFEFY